MGIFEKLMGRVTANKVEQYKTPEQNQAADLGAAYANNIMQDVDKLSPEQKREFINALINIQA